MDEQDFPHDLPAERAILGSCLLRPAALAEVRDVVDADHFYRAAHQTIFAAMVRLDDANRAIDPLLLRNALTTAGQLDEVGGTAYLAKLTDGIPRTTNVQHYAQIVRTKATARAALMQSQALAEELRLGDDEVSDVLQRHGQGLLDLAVNRPAASTVVDAKGLMRITYDAIDRASKQERTGLGTGFRELDRQTGGLQRGDLIIIAARPSMGKTALLTALLRHIAGSGQTALAFELEMTNAQIGMRLLANEAGIDVLRLREQHLTGEEYAAIATGMAQIEDLPFLIDDAVNLAVSDIRARARRVKAKRGALDVILIDYLQLLVSKVREENRNREIEKITRALKSLAKELGVALVLLSQLSRKVEERADKRPQLSDLRDSGAIEQDADMVLFPFRPEVYDTDPALKGHAEIIIAKQRNGPIGTVPVRWQAEYTRFVDAPTSGPGAIRRGPWKPSRSRPVAGAETGAGHDAVLEERQIVDGWRGVSRAQD